MTISPDPRCPTHRCRPPAQPRAEPRDPTVTLIAAAAVLALLAVLATVVLAPPPVPDAPAPEAAPAPAPVDGGGLGPGRAVRAGDPADAGAARRGRAAARAEHRPAGARRCGCPHPATGDGSVPRGFAPTPEGALAQLVALTERRDEQRRPAGLRERLRRGRRPGAPPVAATPLHRGLVAIRARAGLPATGAVPDLIFDWTPASGLIKGSTDRGRYVVACVLGQLDAGAGGRIISTGAGDCQALRYEQGQWWISPGPAAAPAPLAWPGTDEAARVGYRAVRHAR